MKNFVKVALSTTAIFALSANAMLNYDGSNQQSEAYVGAKVSHVKVSSVSPSLLGYGVYGGYNLDQHFGVEAEYMGTNKKKYDNNTQEANVTSYGAYGTYRYYFEGSPFYAKARLGGARSNLTNTVTPAPEPAPADPSAAAGSSDTGASGAGAPTGTPAAPAPSPTTTTTSSTRIAGGIGVGYKTGNLGAELSYNRLSDSTNAASLGVNIAF